MKKFVCLLTLLSTVNVPIVASSKDDNKGKKESVQQESAPERFTTYFWVGKGSGSVMYGANCIVPTIDASTTQDNFARSIADGILTTLQSRPSQDVLRDDCLGSLAQLWWYYEKTHIAPTITCRSSENSSGSSSSVSEVLKILNKPSISSKQEEQPSKQTVKLSSKIHIQTPHTELTSAHTFSTPLLNPDMSDEAFIKELHHDAQEALQQPTLDFHTLTNICSQVVIIMTHRMDTSKIKKLPAKNSF